MDQLAGYRAWLPPIAFGLVVAGTAATLWVSQRLELIPPCRVYVDGCSSISAVGRHPPASCVFRLTMIPAAVLLMLTWLLVGRWLSELGVACRPVCRVIGGVGGVLPLMAITYILLLGVDAPRLEALKELSIHLYFLVALIIKTVTGALLLGQAGRNPLGPSHRLAHGLFWLALALLLTGVTGIVLDQTQDDWSRIRNLMQWHGTTVYTFWYLLLWQAWR